jgi:diacylglycerol O-acyltransferase / wax synthase
VNDAVLALAAGALRRYAHAHGAAPLDARVRVPVCLHRHGERAYVANRTSFYAVNLPLGEPDPTRRLQRITAQTAACKRGRDAVVLDTLSRDVGRLVPPLRDLLAEATLDPRAFALAVSNVVGPAERPTIRGAPVRALYSIVEIGERHALRMAVTSMSGELHVGLCADPAIVGDPEVLATGMAAEASALFAG